MVIGHAVYHTGFTHVTNTALDACFPVFQHGSSGQVQHVMPHFRAAHNQRDLKCNICFGDKTVRPTLSQIEVCKTRVTPDLWVF
jgi:hypothetical protein